MPLNPLLRLPAASLVGLLPGDLPFHAASGTRRVSPGRRRVIAASAVCVGHVLVLLAVWQIRQTLPRSADEERRSVAIRLLAERRERVASAQATQAPAVARVMAMPRLPVFTAEPLDMSSLLIPVPAIAGSAEATGQGVGTAIAPGAAASGGGAPLQLKPQRDVMLGSLTSIAANDPRANTPKPTFEERIAMGADPEACVKLERLSDGSVRRSMGRMGQAQTTLQNTHGVGARGIRTCQ